MELPNHPDLKLLPCLTEWRSENVPHKPYNLFPKHSDKNNSDLEVITFNDLAIAVDRASWWLENNLKKCDKVYAYSGPSDIRWSVFLIAAIKTGRTMIHVPQWFGSDDLLTSFSKYGCSLLLYDHSLPHKATFECLSSHSEPAGSKFQSIEIPDLVEIVGKSDPPPAKFNYVETWNEVADELVAIFLLSDNSGPVLCSNRRIAKWCGLLELAEKDSSILVPDVIGRTVFSTFPYASMEGQSFQLFVPLFFGCTIVTAHPGQKLDAAVVRRIMVNASCDGFVGQVGVLSEFAQSPQTLATMRSLEAIVVGGAYLPDECCGLLRRPRTKVQNIYGQNRAFPCIQERELAVNPRHVSFHKTSGAVFRPSSSGCMELVFKQNEDWDKNQSPSMVSLGSNLIATGDLFSRHPTIPDYWKLIERTDNRIRLAQGEEIDVAKMERIIGTHLLIKSALILRESRKKLLLVLEPWSDAMISLMDGRYKHRFLEDVWPFVEESNQTCSEAGQLCQELTIVIRGPVIRNANHSVDRKRTVKMLQGEVNRTYEAYDEAIKTRDHVNAASTIKTRANGIHEIFTNYRVSERCLE